ncbi:ubiquitin carboxyl-terminal hydrolase 17-like isoform X1 [Papaver somniferum]|uniref:ubiquitin carboxyl-terminal hydrolase 17-like isoform X1 n=1 Tax=Papaver somniferum TaxID=3469 RepID=UPI000E6F936A|nr:ubiquitin carboxyl-terminal hydrolase 17-like isoform X1 [Papaver somniferum]
MLVPGDLGFPPGLIWGFFSFFCLISVLIIKRKWRIAEERNMEILRLMALAAEEDRRVEIEASLEYGGYSSVVSPPAATSSSWSSAASVNSPLPAPPPQYQCAVCYAPTTTRCSRCKSVRYCSGKCQIIHWRKGHKDECHPPSPNIQFSGPKSDSDGKTGLEREKHESVGDGSELGSVLVAEPLETFPEEPRSVESSRFPSSKNVEKAGSVEDGKRAGAISESSSKLVGIAKPTTTIWPVDASANSFPILSSSESLKESTFDNSGCNGLEKKLDVSDTEPTRSLPQKISSLDASLNDLSCADNRQQSVPSSSGNGKSRSISSSGGSSLKRSEVSLTTQTSKAKSGLLEESLDSNGSGNDLHGDLTKSGIREGGNGNLSHLSPNSFQQTVPRSHLESRIHASDVANPVALENKIPASGASPSEKKAPVVFERHSPVFGSERSASAITNQINKSESRKPKVIRSLSSSGSENHPTSVNGEYSSSSEKSSKGEKVQVVAVRSNDVSVSSHNVSNGLKMLAQKAVQHSKLPKLSLHSPSGSDVIGKHDDKMLFSYEVFVKLYIKDKAELHPFGLTNLGNSCYANAVLQCLAYTRPLTAYLLQGLHSKACTKQEWCFICEFESLIQKAKEGKCTLAPNGIVSHLHKIGSHLVHGKQEDAHEFLRFSIDKMQSICLKEAGAKAGRPRAEETTLIGLIFGGYLRSKIRCMKCHEKFEREERMMDLTVEIQGDISTLEEALGQFTATEILDGENKYHCSRCKSYEKAKKRLMVLHAPNVLTIALKRFQSGKFGKLNKAVRFPEVLNLAPYMSGTSDKSPIYSLYAVVVHLDVTNAAFSGHYVCYVKNSQGKWFKMDDSTVKPVELERVLSKGAYMLLYSRCSPRLPGLIQKTMQLSDNKMKCAKCVEPISSSHSGNSSAATRAKSISVVSKCASKTTCWSHDEYPYWENMDRPNSSSDNSSLLSGSDEGSCSTESTRDSADEVPDYIFGRRGWNCPLYSPLSTSDDSNSSSSPSPSSTISDGDRHRRSCYPETSTYPIYSGGGDHDEPGTRIKPNGVGNEGLRDKGDNRPFIYSDTTNHCTKLKGSNSISHNSNSSNTRETDLKGWSKSSLLRRSTKERKTQPLY